MIKITLNRLVRDEKGKALILVLINLVLGGLILTPLLGIMSTGLMAGQVYERKMYEYYAADAGVEDAIWKIQNKEVVICPGDPTRSYTLSDVNGKSVDVTITYIDGLTYRVVSTATGDGGATEIEAYINITPIYDDYSGIVDNVITSPCDYTLQGPTQVDPPEGEEHGPEADYEGDWPTAEILSEVYWEDVKDEFPYYFDTLDVKDYAGGIGPFYRDGTLAIKNTGTAGLTLQLNGTVYITGDTLIGMTDHAFNLDLNGCTIFVESDTGAAPEDEPCDPPNDYALKIGTKCTLTGSGCIIAVGGIEFKPNLNFSEGDFAFVLSLRGTTYMQPNGDFYGALAGSAEVNIQNGNAYWFDPAGTELDFPTLAETDRLCGIDSWELNPQ